MCRHSGHTTHTHMRSNMSVYACSAKRLYYCCSAGHVKSIVYSTLTALGFVTHPHTTLPVTLHSPQQLTIFSPSPIHLLVRLLALMLKNEALRGWGEHTHIIVCQLNWSLESLKGFCLAPKQKHTSRHLCTGPHKQQNLARASNKQTNTRTHSLTLCLKPLPCQ